MKNPATSIREKKTEERHKYLAEKRELLRSARFSARGSQNRNTKHISALKKEIARVLTIETEQAIAIK